jgi:hypothetical protein
VRVDDLGGHRASWADGIPNVKVIMTMIQCQILLYAVVVATSQRSISTDDLGPVEGERVPRLDALLVRRCPPRATCDLFRVPVNRKNVV